ncbi:MAG: VOC family protein [Acidobacteriota bacterium]|nr:VOC family protein [Acidobacteriota bacterium]
MTMIDRAQSIGLMPWIRRRDLLLSLLMTAAWRPRGATGQGRFEAEAVRSLLPVRVLTLNHVSFGCVDLARTVAWYERVLGIPRHAFQDYAGGGLGQTVLRVGSDPPAYMALSQRNAESLHAPPTRRPHFCWGIEDFNVHRILGALAEMRAPARSVLREGTTINGVNFDGPDGAPLQFNPVIACGGVGFLGEVCDTSAVAVRRPGDPPPIQVRTMNHIRYYVTDLPSTLEWYQKLTDMEVVSYQEREGGPRTVGYEGAAIPVLRIGSGPQHMALVEGRGSEADVLHVGFGVDDFEPDRVVGRLAEHGVAARMRMREGETPEILVDGPDGVRLQLQDVSYCGGGGALGNLCPPRAVRGQ